MITKIWLLLLTVILALLQATLLSLNLLWLLVALVGWWYSDFAFGFSFLAGLILDLAKGELLGLSSIKFLVTAWVIIKVKARLAVKEGQKLRIPPSLK